jgi:fructose-1-phosphate kinase PfkB-like protein
VINIPPEFRYLVACFHQDSLEGVVNEQQWIATAIEFLSKPQKQVVRGFLDDLLAGDVSNADLTRIWESSDPDFIIPNEVELRQFLTLVRGNLSV